jgi:hypothetical protein
MPGDANVAVVAALLADPTRAALLMALLDGRALPAGDLVVIWLKSRSSHGMHHGKKPGSKRQSTWRSTKLLVKERRFLPCKIPYRMVCYERESCESAKEERKNDGAYHQAQMVTRRAGSS